ncbi:MAG TPA: FMN-binding negative transcriptional regulator [Alphaproteobacteria bacterium]|nr:FMN-binding negative transcriptional regulator [Alphaproteobacteria bacterium]
MYVPAHFDESDPKKLASILSDHNFGILITAGPQGLFASHLPFVTDPERPLERLRAHMAKANAHWRDIGAGAEALAIFQGPHAYVSASWYAHQPRVPTWNYVALHVYGRVRILDGPEGALETLTRTVAHQEGHRTEPWRIEDLPQDYLARMLKGVVAIELAVSRIEGKFKLSQNVARDDQEGAIAGLLAEGSAASLATAEAMRLACGLA